MDNEKKKKHEADDNMLKLEKQKLAGNEDDGDAALAKQRTSMLRALNILEDSERNEDDDDDELMASAASSGSSKGGPQRSPDSNKEGELKEQAQEGGSNKGGELKVGALPISPNLKTGTTCDQITAKEQAQEGEGLPGSLVRQIVDTSLEVAVGLEVAVAKGDVCSSCIDAVGDDEQKKSKRNGNPNQQQDNQNVVPGSDKLPSLRRSDKGRSQGEVGAHRFQGSQMQTTEEEDSTIRQGDCSEGGLAEALPVQEEDHPEMLPRASLVDDASKKRQNETKRVLTRNLLAVLGLIVVVVVVVLVAVLVSREDNSPTPTTATTVNPTAAPTSLEQHILSYLSEEAIAVISDDPDSPQARALEWMLTDQLSNEYPTPQHLIQRYALATLYYNFKGGDWLNNDGWLDHNTSECDWFNKHNFGMKEELKATIPLFLSGFEQPPVSERCNQEGLYQHLWLDSNGLVGSLPEELFQVTSLKTLGVGFNSITGTISSYVGQLTDLTGFFIPFAELTGTLPTQMGLLSSLEVINLYVNDLSGTIPQEMWYYENMTSYSPNSFSPRSDPQILPTELCRMTKIRWFPVDTMVGTVPTCIGLMTDVVGLWMNGMPGSDNIFTGTIPTEIGLMTNVVLLELNDNAFTGQIPSQLGLLTRLNYMNLGNNMLSGPLPLEVENLVGLENAILENNRFTGIVPEAMCNLNGSCYSYPTNCAALEKPLLFDCTPEFCGCDCPCDGSSNASGTR